MQREFKGADEIRKEPGFREDNPIRIDNYSALLGWYKLSEESDELACCVQRPNGSLCKTAHRHGWVARLADDSVTIVGSFCAKDKFGADAAIVTDIRRATRLLKETNEAERLQELLLQRDEILPWCIDAMARIAECGLQLEGILSSMAPARARLESMSRSGNGQIQVTGRRLAKRNKDGEVIEDTMDFPINVGRLRNVEACNPGRVSGLKAAVHGLWNWARRPPDELSRLPAKQAKQLSASFRDYPKLKRDLVDYQGLVAAFEQNDFSVLAYVVREFGDRAKVVRAASLRLPTPLGKDAAKAWVMHQDAELKDRHRADRLIFG